MSPDIVYKLALCPRFDSWWHHLQRVILRSDFFYIRAIAQLVEQRTDIVYKLALCPRFDSWWHHLQRVILRSDSFLFSFYPLPL